MSKQSENKRCNKPIIEYDTIHQLEFVGKFIVHDCALFRMHARCRTLRRFTLRTNDVASRLLSLIAIINSNMFSSLRKLCMTVRSVGCMLGVMHDVESL